MARRLGGYTKLIMIMKKAPTLDRVRKLLKLYQAGKIPTLAEHEVHPDLPRGSRENYLYFTLPPCINFQRSSPAMWKSALATWNDPITRYVFFPEKAVGVSRTKVQTDLSKYNLAVQRNKHTDIWMAISKTLHEFYKDDVRALLAVADFDVAKVLQLVQADRREYFTHLRGPKMTNYWLYILSQYTDAKLSHMEEISIIPDTHVLQCSMYLGISDAATTVEEVAARWKKLLRGSGIAPVEMHPVLWNWSRNNFEPNV